MKKIIIVIIVIIGLGVIGFVSREEIVNIFNSETNISQKSKQEAALDSELSVGDSTLEGSDIDQGDVITNIEGIPEISEALYSTSVLNRSEISSAISGIYYPPFPEQLWIDFDRNGSLSTIAREIRNLADEFDITVNVPASGATYPLIDDDTFTTATNMSAASSESIKAYVDSIPLGGLQNWDIGVQIDTGENYFDGRRIYRQTWDMSGVPNNTVLVTGVEHIVDFAGQINNSLGDANYNSTWTQGTDFIRPMKTAAGVMNLQGTGAFMTGGAFRPNTVITIWYTLT